VQLLKDGGFTVEGVRRKLDGYICPPSPPVEFDKKPWRKK
jgi:hypothetical protein